MDSDPKNPNLRCSGQSGSRSNSASPQTIAVPDPTAPALLGASTRVFEVKNSGPGVGDGADEWFLGSDRNFAAQRSEAPEGRAAGPGEFALTPKTPAPGFLSLSMSVLHARALARGGVAGRTQALARTVRHGVAPRLRLAMTGRWGLLPALAWRASTRRGVLRASGNAAAHKLVAALAIDGAKWGLKC